MNGLFDTAFSLIMKQMNKAFHGKMAIFVEQTYTIFADELYWIFVKLAVY